MDIKMSWNMIIFGFGFLLGGLSTMLILGLVSLAGQKTATFENQVTIKNLGEILPIPKSKPRLTVLSSGKNRHSFPGQKRKAIS
jgi:hypothetical protein